MTPIRVDRRRRTGRVGRIRWSFLWEVVEKNRGRSGRRHFQHGPGTCAGLRTAGLVGLVGLNGFVRSESANVGRVDGFGTVKGGPSPTRSPTGGSLGFSLDLLDQGINSVVEYSFLESPITLLNLPFQEKEVFEKKALFFACVTKCSFFVCALSDPP